MPDKTSRPADWLRHAAQHDGEAAALLIGRDGFDYATLHTLAGRLYRVLHAHGLEPGATLLVESRSATLLAFLFHTALIAGYVLWPMDPRLPETQRRQMSRLLKIDLMIIDDDAVRPSKDIAFMTATELLARAVQEKPLCVSEAAGCPDQQCLMLASSGSSGAPKLITLSERNLQANCLAANERLELAQASVWLDCLPLVHIGGLSILLRCLATRATVVLNEGFDAAAVMEDLYARRVTHVSLVPAMLGRLMDLNQTPPDCLQVVLVGGAPLDPLLAGGALKAGWPLWVTYGMTETASMLTARKLDIADPQPQQVGIPLDGFEVRIENEVVQVRGDAVHGLKHRRGAHWFSTGDRGRLDESGRLIILGRRDNVLLSGGEKVDPEAVERLLVNCPGVDEVAVTGCRDPLWGEKVVAVFCGDIEETVFDRLCRESIEGVMRPRRFVKVTSLPRTVNGKLDRAALRRLVES